ncbi:hypothetical protein ABIE58_003964 [Roseovarius sp. MBR-78]|jgi:hypothetical protein|uniref:hypothetical protein n=1 Tax=Roseovarius sp. MBR-78 TaxID=3156460 RepID=UPI003397F889
MNVHNPNVALRAALYLRVSTNRQAEHDVSIPDQKRQAKPGAKRGAISLSRPSSKPERRLPTTAAPSFSA